MSKGKNVLCAQKYVAKMRLAFLLVLIFMAFSVTATAQTQTVLYDFGSELRRQTVMSPLGPCS